MRWRTSSNTDSVVRYGTSSTSLTQTVSSATLKTNHELRISGLSPNTRYYYSVGSSSATLASGGDQFFITAPSGQNATRIWVVGDAGTANSNQRAVRDAYYSFTGSRHTDLWLMLAAALRSLSKAEGRTLAIAEIAQGWAERAPQAALAWAKELLEPSERRTAFEPLLTTWAASDPRAAAEALAQLPDELGRTRLADQNRGALGRAGPDGSHDLGERSALGSRARRGADHGPEPRAS